MADETNTAILAYLADAVHVRVAAYRDKAAQLRSMAETEPIGSLRSSLLALSRRFDSMADSIEPKRQR